MPNPTFNIDFEGTGSQGSNTVPANTPNSKDGEEVTPLNGGIEIQDVDGTKPTNENEQPKSEDVHSSTGELEQGTQLEIDGANYTVDKNGNIVNDKGEIFKKKEEVSEWLNSVNVENPDEPTELSIDSIQSALGETIVDADGNPVQFTNDIDGVKAYVSSVLDLKAVELQQAAINKLYADNPMLKQFQDYVAVNGSPRGFGDLPDRSGITLDKDNENQLISVIQMAAKEFNNPTVNNNYIQYLKDSGALYDEAKNQLKALVDKDKQIKADIEARAEQQRKDAEEQTKNYWSNVSKVITGRVIGGFKIPESFTKDVDGKKLTFTTNDFYNYLSKATDVDASGRKVTGYQRDLNALSDEEYLNKELLDAWLMFTGGSYKDLVKMAVNEEQVKQLRINSQKRNASKTVKIINNKSGKADINNIILQ